MVGLRERINIRTIEVEITCVQEVNDRGATALKDN